VSEDAALQWRELSRAFNLYSDRLNRNKAVNVNSEGLREETRELAQIYFRRVRHVLHRLQLNDVAEPLSVEFEALLVLSEGRNATASYKKHVKAIRKLIPKVTSQLEIQGDGPINPVSSSETDQRILKTLNDLVPSAALSYEQALRDMADPKRISFRGPAHELRESLREVLDRFAPAADMQKSGVKHEKDEKKYTMKQKVRFIFKNRERSMTESAVPENAVNTIDELIGSMTRSTYDRGSLSAHQERGKKACEQLKRYVDVVLHDLLEI
jgi:Predicted pPIWI-associating nuclease